MIVFFHCTFAWMCFLFPQNSLHLFSMSAEKLYLEVLLFLVWWNRVLRKLSARLYRELWLTYVDFREKTWLDHGNKTNFFAHRIPFTWSYFINAVDPTFYGLTSVITQLGCWENTRNACKSLAFSPWFTSFSSVFPASRVGYHAGKPFESEVYP